jgi:hypothetical protein
MKKLETNWVDGDALPFIALKGEMKIEFAKNAKKKR